MDKGLAAEIMDQRRGGWTILFAQLDTVCLYSRGHQKVSLGGTVLYFLWFVVSLFGRRLLVQDTYVLKVITSRNTWHLVVIDFV